MLRTATPTSQACTFCEIGARQSEASIVYEDQTVVAFMDRFPVTRGHLLVVPRKHASGLEGLDGLTSAHAWSVAHELARALRRSTITCEGINVLLCDGEVAFQTVFHFHLHVIPRSTDDGWTSLLHTAPERERALLESDAHAIRHAFAEIERR